MRVSATISPLIVLLAGIAAPLAAQSVRLDVPIEELEARAQRDSCDAAAWYNLAVGRISQNRFDAADTLLQQAVRLDPGFALAYFALGLVQDRNERYWSNLRRSGGDSAIAREWRSRMAYERKAFLIDPFLDVRLLGSVYRRGAIAIGAQRAFEDLIQGKYEDAYRRFDDVLRYVSGRGGLDSISPSLLWIHTLAAARTNHLPEAIADAEALIRQSLAHEHDDSTHIMPLRTNEYRYMLASLQHRVGNVGPAVEGYLQVGANDLGNYMAHVQLARIFEAGRNMDQAIRERRAAADVNPEDHTVQFDLGAALARAGQWQAAEEALLRARSMQACYARTWHALGVVHQQLGKRDEARDDFNHFLSIAPARLTNQINDARQRLAALP